MSPTNTRKRKTRSANDKRPFQARRSAPLWIWFASVAALLIVAAVFANPPSFFTDWRQEQETDAAQLFDEARAAVQEVEQEDLVYDEAASVAALEAIQERDLIIDVHEHIQSLNEVPVYLNVMNETGVRMMCLMGSSEFTITLDESVGFTGYDENNEELIKIVNEYPGRFEAWPTLDPQDPNKLEKLKDLVARGATGLKLYISHGYLTKENEYMFHTVALDDPGMLPVYAFLEENYLPVCIHLNPYEGRPGFAEEFIAVLTQFPDLKVVSPHFMLSSIVATRLREFLDTFPNLYTDVSFGDYYVKPGLKRISRDPHKFRRLVADYPERIMFASDLVLTAHFSKTESWVRDQYQAYLMMLTRENYTTPIIPGEKLNGLALPAEQLANILYKNYERFKELKPEGTDITREIDWSRMNQEPTGRPPGVALPPPPPDEQ